MAGSLHGLRVWDGHTLELLHTYDGGEVIAAAIDPSVTRTAFVDDDTNDIIHIYDISSMTLIESAESTQLVSCIVFHPTLNQLASGSTDASFTIWDLESMEEPIHTLRGHTAFIECVCYSLDGSQLASACNDGTIILWDSTTGAHIKSIPFHGRIRNLAFSEDGTKLWVIAYALEHIYMWDTSPSSCEFKPHLRVDQVLAICIPYSMQGGYVL